jgi:hypothetical protein
MASVRTMTFTLGLALAARVALAQAPAGDLTLTADQVAVACAPAPYLGVVPVDASHVVANQDTVTRSLFGDIGHQLVINAGTDRGVQLSQVYFVRRIFRTADDVRSKEPHIVATTGWVRITAVNKLMALANTEHTCSEIREGDFLEPFHAPALPEGLFAAESTGALDFQSYGRILYGQSERWISGTGDFVLIDRGTDKNVSVGSHFAIYRDREVTGVPLTPIGEATAVAVGPAMAVVRINQSRDAITARDVVVPRGPAQSPKDAVEALLPAAVAATITPQPTHMMPSVVGAIQELDEYRRLMSDKSPRAAALHLRKVRNIIQKLPRPRQDVVQGVPSEVSLTPTIDATVVATPDDIQLLVQFAIRSLTEYGSLMSDNAPRGANDRLMAATRTVDRLQKLTR